MICLILFTASNANHKAMNLQTNIDKSGGNTI